MYHFDIAARGTRKRWLTAAIRWRGYVFSFMAWIISIHERICMRKKATLRIMARNCLNCVSFMLIVKTIDKLHDVMKRYIMIPRQAEQTIRSLLRVEKFPSVIYW